MNPDGTDQAKEEKPAEISRPKPIIQDIGVHQNDANDGSNPTSQKIDLNDQISSRLKGPVKELKLEPMDNNKTEENSEQKEDQDETGETKPDSDDKESDKDLDKTKSQSPEKSQNQESEKGIVNELAQQAADSDKQKKEDKGKSAKDEHIESLIEQKTYEVPISQITHRQKTGLIMTLVIVILLIVAAGVYYSLNAGAQSV